MSLRFSSCALCLLFAAHALPERAIACSFHGCFPAAARPSASSIPSNAGGVWLSAQLAWTSERADQIVTLSTTSGDETIAITELTASSGALHALLVPDALVVGETLRLDATPGCLEEGGIPGTDPEMIATWTITDAVPKPTALGTLSSELAWSTTGGSRPEGGGCAEKFEAATARVSLVADPGAEPWTDAMIFDTLVDGESWRPEVSLVPWHNQIVGAGFGGSRIGRGVDVVFAACDGTSELGLGTHTVAMRGTLPDGTVVETPEIEITLSCRGKSIEGDPGYGGGCAITPARAATLLPLVMLTALGVLARRRRRS